VCDGSVSGTVAYACVKRRPLCSSAVKASVFTRALAVNPIASARVVSSVTSRIDGRPTGGDGFAASRLHAEAAARRLAASRISGLKADFRLEAEATGSMSP